MFLFFKQKYPWKQSCHLTHISLVPSPSPTPFLNLLKAYRVIWLSWLIAVFITWTGMHNNTCEHYKGFIDLTGSHSTARRQRLCTNGVGGNSGVVLMGDATKSTERSLGGFLEFRCFCAIFYWLIKASAHPSHNSLPHMLTSLMDHASFCV